MAGKWAVERGVSADGALMSVKVSSKLYQAIIAVPTRQRRRCISSPSVFYRTRSSGRLTLKRDCKGLSRNLTLHLQLNDRFWQCKPSPK